MDLKLYLVKNRLTVEEFATSIHYSRTHLSAVMHGKQNASYRLAALIEKETKGKVKAKEFHSKHKKKKVE